MKAVNFKISKFSLSIYFRYRYEKRDALSDIIWNKDDWKISIWYKKQQSRKGYSKYDYLNEYLIGFDLAIAKLWFKFHF